MKFISVYSIKKRNEKEMLLGFIKGNSMSEIKEKIRILKTIHNITKYKDHSNGRTYEVKHK